jgi:RNA polymerase sigma factor (sigma-70 family)
MTAAPKSKHAFVERLSREFRAPLVRFFEKRIGRQAEIEDLVQEVLLRLANGSRIESVEKPEAYLFRTAANLLQDRQRSLKARATAQHDSYEDDIHGDTREMLNPEAKLLGLQAIEQLVAALYDLPERTRTIWTLYHLDDLSHGEIARRLGLSVSTVEKHMGRGTAYLLKRIAVARL